MSEELEENFYHKQSSPFQKKNYEHRAPLYFIFAQAWNLCFTEELAKKSSP